MKLKSFAAPKHKGRHLLSTPLIKMHKGNTSKEVPLDPHHIDKLIPTNDNERVSIKAHGGYVAAKLSVDCPTCKSPMSCTSWNDTDNVASRGFECLNEGCLDRISLTMRVYAE